ncbi:MAG: CRISPR-associated helicase Cas3', partial [Promethearchaeota archaeon]
MDHHLQGKKIEKSLILRIWGKTRPYHPLLFHLIDAGNVAYALLDAEAFQSQLQLLSNVTGCLKSDLKHWLAYITALHDIGKCTALFQTKAKAMYLKPLIHAGIPFSTLENVNYRHEAFSGIWIQKHLIEKFGWDKYAVRTIGSCLRGHHGDFFSKLIKETSELKPSWSELRDIIVSKLQEVFLHSTSSNQINRRSIDFLHQSVIGVLLSGLIILSDWICSNENLFINPLQNDAFGNVCQYQNEVNGISKDDAIFKKMVPFLESVNNYRDISLRHAKRAVEKMGFNTSYKWDPDATFKKLWNFNVLRPIQVCCENIVKKIQQLPDLFIIEAPMGEGKTEAALYLASILIARRKLAGMYIALPTAATSNQMHKRVNEFMKNNEVNSISNARLIHGMSWLQDDEYTPNYSHTIIGESENDKTLNAIAFQWFKPKRRALLSPYAVGTVDQSMLSVLRVKFGVLRLLGLSGKVLIIDEVHAYDAYMSRIIIKLLKWAKELHTPVILLSATLPLSKKKMLFKASGMDVSNFDNSGKGSMLAYPLITAGKRDGRFISFPVKGGSTIENVFWLKLYYNSLGNQEAIANIALDAVNDGGCICVIANTVRSAQSIYSKIVEFYKKNFNDQNDQINYSLFHARFKAMDRNCIEKKVLNDFGKGSLKRPDEEGFHFRPKKSILVATQVVEQSLDLDFDEMITEIAPIDAILQRSGRMWRHKERKKRPKSKPILHVICPNLESFSFGSTAKIYSSYLLLKTLNVLYGRHQIIIPDEIRSLVEGVYDDVDVEESSKPVPYELLIKNK